jgi:hypothetical protein
VIREGKQPVVLLWAELPRVDRTLLATLAARKIAVVSQRGRRVLGGVVGAEHADPAAAALAAARDLAAAGDRVALHLDALLVTPNASGMSLTGPSVERPEDWLPPVTWAGVVLTRALATVTQVPTRATNLGPGFVMLGETGMTTELFGREALISDLVADAAAALAGNGRRSRRSSAITGRQTRSARCRAAALVGMRVTWAFRHRARRPGQRLAEPWCAARALCAPPVTRSSRGPQRPTAIADDDLPRGTSCSTRSVRDPRRRRSL